MSMNSKFILVIMLVLSNRLMAGEPATNDIPRELTNVWEYINFPFPTNASNEPFFMVSSGAEWDQVSRGLRLDVMNITQGFSFIRTNGVTARIYRANGEISEPTPEGKKFLNDPVSASTASFPGENLVPGVMTYFSWGTNALEESWLEVVIGPERYWLEIPYGLDWNPTNSLFSCVPAGPPQFAAAMKSLTAQDHVVNWKSVHYYLGKTRDGRELSLNQSNPFDVRGEVELYEFPETQNLNSPHTDVRILDADGTTINGRCVNLHLDDEYLRRTDTFDFGRYGDDLRCWGKIEISLDDINYEITIPSSLYKFLHGHPRPRRS